MNTVHKVFPTCIFQKDVGLSSEHNQQLLTKIYEIRKRNPESHGPIYQTKDDLHTLDEFKHLTLKIETAFTDILKYLDYKDYDFHINSMWGNVYNSAQGIEPHTHANNFYSGVYTLKCVMGFDSSMLLFSDPRPQANVFYPLVRKRTAENGNLAFVPTKEGELILFPAWLQHYTKPNKSKEHRVTISFNIQLKGEMETHASLQWARF